MEKRYQVFVSSTYQDLQEERKEVMQALLELDCIPAGMELFPASNEDQWTLIKRVIDDCDYYLLIIGGRYGSCNEEGIGYTEMEFRYALQTGKPIVSFLHETPDSISNGKSEQEPEKKKMLEEFRRLAQTKMTKYWTNPDNLGSVISRSMIKLMKQFPAVGWVRADNITDVDSTKELLRLREEIDNLKKELDNQVINPPSGSENLSQGAEQFSIILKFSGYDEEREYYDYDLPFELSWNEIFTAISPYLVTEDSETTMVLVLINYMKRKYGVELEELRSEDKLVELYGFKLDTQSFQTIKVQLKALGLIEISKKSKSVKDQSTYWTLTPYGEHIMTQLIAIQSRPRDY